MSEEVEVKGGTWGGFLCASFWASRIPSGTVAQCHRMAALFPKEIPLFLNEGKPWPALQPLLCVLPEFGFNGKAAAGASGGSTKGVCVFI